MDDYLSEPIEQPSLHERPRTGQPHLDPAPWSGVPVSLASTPLTLVEPEPLTFAGLEARPPAPLTLVEPEPLTLTGLEATPPASLALVEPEPGSLTDWEAPPPTADPYDRTTLPMLSEEDPTTEREISFN